MACVCRVMRMCVRAWVCVRKMNSVYVFSVSLRCSTFLYFFWDFVVVFVIEADALAHRVIDTRESVCVCVWGGGMISPRTHGARAKIHRTRPACTRDEWKGPVPIIARPHGQRRGTIAPTQAPTWCECDRQPHPTINEQREKQWRTENREITVTGGSK